MLTKRRCSLLVLAAAALLLPGCGIDHIRTLRDAEETFSRAAEKENRIRFARDEALKDEASGTTAPPGVSLAGDLGESTGYRLAAEMTAKLVREKRAELEQDKLLCTTYVIRAFSLWRLGEFHQAVQASKEQCGSAAPRDAALLKVVGALVGIDESNARTFNATRTTAEYDTTKDQIGEGLDALKGADSSLPRDHPLRAYFFAVRLAALRVMHVAGNRENLPDGQERASREKARDDADDTLVQYRTYLRCALKQTDDPEHKSVGYWQELFNIDDPKNPKFKSFATPTC